VQTGSPHADELDLELVVARAAQIAGSVLAAEAERVDREAVWVEKGMAALLSAGFGGLVVPRRHGGLDHGMLGLVRVCEQLGRECASTAICYGMHCVGSAVIAAKATHEHGQRYLEPIARGEHLTTLALSEPGSGSHFYLPETTAVADGDELVISGAKTFVTNATHADSYVISVTAPPDESGPGLFSCLVLPGDAEGLEWGEPWHGLGMRGNDSRALTLHDVRLPQAALLGEEGDEIWYVFHVVAPYFLCAMSGTYLGVAAAALAEAVEHLTRRRYSTTGDTPAAQPVVQHRVGELWAALERTRRLVYYAAEAADAGSDDALVALCSAKAEIAQTGAWLVNEALTLTGGIAYRENSRLARALRDIRAAHVMAPTTDILRTWAGRALLGRPLLAE